MGSIIQRSFAGGIIGPELAGRADQAKYQTGLRDAVNVIIQRYGGVTNRPGTRFLAEARDGDAHPVRLVKFVYNAEQTYILEFGHFYLRVYRDGGLVVPAAAAWSNATAYVVGDMALAGGVTYYCIQAHTNQAPPNGTYWFAMTAGTYEIPTPYDSADVRALQYVQSGDVISIVHPSYAPRELRRAGHTAWTMVLASFAPAVSRPTNCAGTAGGAGANSYRYRITAYDVNTLEESYAGREATKAITGASQANPCQITCVGHGYSTGDEVFITGIVGMTQLNDRTFVVTSTGANTFTLDGVNSTAYTAWSSGGTVARTYVRINAAAAPTASAPISLSWSNLGDGFAYWIYRYKDGVYEFIGEAAGNSSAASITFADTNIAGQAAYTPPVERSWFNVAGAYPSTITYVQQRLALANSIDEPERIWLSQVGNYSNFSRSLPVQADDAIEFKIAGRQVNAVRHLLEVGGRLVVLTAAAEWTIAGDSAGVVRPTDINPRKQSESGASLLAPVVIGNTALYVQARGSLVRDLRYDFESEGYNGRDLTIFCPELFDGHAMLAFDYQQIPHSVSWLARDDGQMLGLTYVRDHDVWGWHRHVTGADAGDTIEDLVSVPEGDEDALYAVVRRLAGGVRSRYIERFASRRFTDIAVDAFFVDAGLTYDGRNTGATTMTLSGGTTWDHAETLTCTASAGVFAAGNVDDQVVLTGADGEPYACTITAYTSPTVVSVRPDRALPADVQAVPTLAWALAVLDVAGLDHLEGRTVTALCDGNVNPPMVVTGGAVTLASPSIIAHVGLPYTSRIETLDAETLVGETWADKKRKIHAVSIKVKDTRGLWMGFGEGSLYEHQPLTGDEGFDQPMQPYSGLITENVDAAWEKSGKVIVEQRDPLPMTILAIIPNGVLGGV